MLVDSTSELELEIALVDLRNSPMCGREGEWRGGVWGWDNKKG